MKAYLIIDIGTGNLRVAVCNTDGHILAVETEDIKYDNDEAYLNAQCFDAENLWISILKLCKQTLRTVRTIRPEIEVVACTTTSQREGVVLIDKEGRGIIGLPNHDHRGAEWERDIPNPDLVYQRTGRKVSSLFSALKVVGIKEKRQDLFQKTEYFTSISDWVIFKLSGFLGYEHSQASETNLYNVELKQWDLELCKAFGLSFQLLPPLVHAGTKVGFIQKSICEELELEEDIHVLVGGADTQMAIHSTNPKLGDIIIVAGTTTPIVKVKKEYALDGLQRTWTNSHIMAGQYILEVNAGVTGLNIQRLKGIFYKNESYDEIAEELQLTSSNLVDASLGSLVCSEQSALTSGGFVFRTPVNHELTRADFLKAAMLDVAFSIKENVDVLVELEQQKPDYMWICGGGAQSDYLNQLLADILQVDLRIREGFRQASVSGAVHLCNTVMDPQRVDTAEDSYRVISKRNNHYLKASFDSWKKTRNRFKQVG